MADDVKILDEAVTEEATIIIVNQLPIIDEQLSQVKEIIANRTAAAMTLKCTEANRQEVKKLRANCISDGRLLSEILYVRDRVFIYANDGSEVKEVFRGYIWKKEYTNNKKRIISLICYDNLIYLQKSEDSRYYSSGKKTEEIITDICRAWGIDVIYRYKSIEHKKLPLQGKISDMLQDTLDKVKKNTSIKYVIKSSEDTIYIEPVGANYNGIMYELNRKENAIATSSITTMDDVVTKILFLGEADDNGEVPINDTLEGNVERWGTLQKIMSDDSDNSSNSLKSLASQDDEEDTLYESARDEGEYILQENGQPKDTYKVYAINNPWLRKGDLVKVCAGDMNYMYIITSISHDAVDKEMYLELELADEDNLSITVIESVYSNSEAGKSVYLNNAPVYESSDSDTIVGYVSGTYYLYDGKKILERYRIVENADYVGQIPMNEYIIGWLPADYVRGMIFT